jgi:hypothetical protein
MMYQSGYIVSIQNSKRQTIRESSSHEIFLPFHSEYSILLKNKNQKKAVCEVTVDGMDTLGGKRLVLPPNGEIILERFCLDGDLQQGKKFLFVPVDDPRVQDSSNSSNGVIQVRFWLEAESVYINPVPYVNPWPHHPWNPWNPWNPYYPYRDNTWTTFSDTNKGTGGTFCKGVSNSVNYCSTESRGATVESSNISQQQFHPEQVGSLESNFTTITLRLKPYKESVTVSNTRHVYCTRCGRKNSRGDNFCSSCGNKLEGRI